MIGNDAKDKDEVIGDGRERITSPRAADDDES